MTQQIETIIDGRSFSWGVDGGFGWGEGGPLCRTDSDPLLTVLGAEGYRIIDLPAAAGELIRSKVLALSFLSRLTDLELYHESIRSNVDHMRIVEMSRDLRYGLLGLDGGEFTKYFSGLVGLPLSPTLPQFGTEIVQLRINRPGSTDYNPPHRDGSLPHLARTLNVWIPVAGVDASTSLPIIPGSHAIAESECWQTAPGGAIMDGRPYRVPAIGRLRDGPLRMTRAPLRFGQALLFTPFMIHGLAFNDSSNRTRMALELRFSIEA